MNSKISYIGSGAVLIGALLIIIIKPISSLSTQGQVVLAGILITLGLWIFKPFKLPFSAGALFFAAYMMAVGIPTATVFSGFTQSAVWTLVAALFFGFVLKKTGLGYRLALMILKLFRPSYLTLTLAWALIGLILSVLTPSMTVRVAIMMPIAVSCTELCNLKAGSKGNSLILLTAFAMALIPGGGWITGSLTGPVLQGAYDSVQGLEGMLNFTSWFSVSFVPVEIATVLMLAGSLIFLKPKEKLPEEAARAIKETKLGRIKKDEIITAVILVACFILFLSGNKLSISSTIVCLGAVVLFFAFGIIKASEIGEAVSWDLIVFLGMALSLGNICSSVGIIEWLSGLIVPALKPFAGNPFLFVGVVTVFFFMWHFIDIASFFPTFVIFPAVFPAIQEAYGVSPLIFAPILALAGCAFFVSYENHWVLMGQAVARERSWTGAHLGTYGTIYFVSSLIGIMIAVPIWQNMGLIF